MKRSIITLFSLFITSNILSAFEPGCTRKNSDGIIRELLFMHIENGKLEFAISLLDTETMTLSNRCGTSIIQSLNMLKDKFDISPVLNHLKMLEEKKAKSTPQGAPPSIPDLPNLINL